MPLNSEYCFGVFSFIITDFRARLRGRIRWPFFPLDHCSCGSSKSCTFAKINISKPFKCHSWTMCKAPPFSIQTNAFTLLFAHVRPNWSPSFSSARWASQRAPLSHMWLQLRAPSRVGPFCPTTSQRKWWVTSVARSSLSLRLPRPLDSFEYEIIEVLILPCDLWDYTQINCSNLRLKAENKK